MMTRKNFLVSSISVKRLMIIALIGLVFSGCEQIANEQIVSEEFTEEKPVINLLENKEKLSKVRFVDQIGSKYLFRGPSPLNKDGVEFNYDGLVESIILAGKEADIDVPEDFYLVDVSLLHLDVPSDRNIIIKEEKFFQENPTLGQFQSMDTWGTEKKIVDESLSEENRISLINNVPNWLPTSLPERVELLRKWMEDSNLPKKVDKPTVIYVHCFEGCDRTGEVIGAYLMRFKNVSWEEINESNSSTCGRLWRCDYYQATQWYCAWLNESKRLPLNCQTSFKCLKDRDDK